MSLVAPFITNAEDGVLNYFEVKNGVQMEVPNYGDVSEGDMVTVFWGNVFKLERIVLDPEEIPFYYDVSNDFPPACLYDGEYMVYYTVEDKVGNITTSDAVTIKVSTNS